MAQTKGPLSERDANAAPKKRSGKGAVNKASSYDLTPKIAPDLTAAAKSLAQTHGKKRAHEDDDYPNNTPPSSQRPPPVVTIDTNPPELDEDSEESAQFYKWNCNQIRSKINALTRSGEMKVGELQKAIGVSSSSYQNFMKKSGPDGGAGSDVYDFAHRFFDKREKEGIKAPRAKKAKINAAGSSSNDKDKDTTTNKASTSGSKKKEKEKDAEDANEITLPDEEKGTVPVFDTCNDIRTKINAYLRQDGTTKAALRRGISQTFVVAGTPDTQVTDRQLDTFLKKKGATGGCTSPAFYAAYVFFEKLRIKQGKPKSKKRQEMEEQHGAKGMRTDYDPAQGMIIGPGEKPSIDSYGNFCINGKKC